MDISISSAIEKIKLQEQDTEAKLKEKRELESHIALLQRNIRDTHSQSDKFQQEEIVLNKQIQEHLPNLEVGKMRILALASQVEVIREELKELKEKVNQSIFDVWKLRSSFCDKIEKTSDDYDVWALLIKPVHTELKPRIVNTPEKKIYSNEGRLKCAIERREKAIAERNRIIAEPENGEEFVRIKNALRYSSEKLANMKNLEQNKL
ncbi:unnamed protein product [Leptosia nina]|uniref:Uncharacterized protein n=1 Tax=Leptosia nina TaxID=320188 RepID=A0AAV1JDC9_9NEOP